MSVSTLQDYKDFLKKMSDKSGLDFSSDGEGLVSLRVDDAYTLNLQYVEATSKILCFVDMVTLPKSCDKSVYRALLAGTLFGRETAGGYFALEDESETVVYNYLFDFDPATSDPEAVLASLENVLTLVETWAGRIGGMVDGGADDGDADNPSSGEVPGDGTDFPYLKV